MLLPPPRTEPMIFRSRRSVAYRQSFTGKDPTINIKYSVPERVARIQRFLTWHQIRFVSGTWWIVLIPNKDEVGVWPLSRRTTRDKVIVA